MGKSPGKTVQTQTQSTGYDGTTEKARQQAYAAANGAASAVAGVDPSTSAALEYYKNLMSGGATGAAALSGDQGAISQLFNPYQSNVLDAVNGQFGDLRKQATLASNDAATRAGAFGGSRAAVALGTQQAALDKTQAQTLAGLQYQGFNDTMNRAGQSANLGFGAAGAAAPLGQYAQIMNDPNLRNMNIWKQYFSNTPVEQTTSGTSTGTQQGGKNGASGFLGGAATGAQIGSAFGPWGTGIGAGIGGLIGMF